MFSQNLSYGVLFGVSYMDSEVKNSLNSVTEVTSEKPNIHFGAFLDYQFSSRLGVKLNGQYNRSYEQYRLRYIPNPKETEFSINSIQLIPHLKFDVETEYSKGFYFLAGPRISFVLSAEDQSGNDVSNFYKGTNFGAQLGFGINIAKMFAIEIIGDYGFSDISEAEPTEIRTAGAYINLVANIESIINK
jgi:hypothetical protein